MSKGRLFFSLPVLLHKREFVTLLFQCRCCGSFQTPLVKNFRPHQLGGDGRNDSASSFSDTSTTTTTTTTPASSFLSSPVNLAMDSFEPPSVLSTGGAVEYLAALRGLHRSLGITTTASRVRWTARTFLLTRMPREPPWTMTEDFACAIVVSCAHFEVSLSECPHGFGSGEFLLDLWQKRLSSLSSTPSPSPSFLSSSFVCGCEEAVLLGQLTLAVLEQVSNRVICMKPGDHMLWSRLLCEALLPSIMRLLQGDVFLESPKVNDCGDGLTATQATAFTLLLSSLTKAAVTRWARRDSNILDAHKSLVFGTPPSLLNHAEKEQRSLSAVYVTVPQLPLAKLSLVVQRYVSSLTAQLHVKETALPVLRFFTITQCLPCFVSPHCDAWIDACGGCNYDEQEEHIKSLVLSITRVLCVAFEHRVVFVSHQLSNLASIYARVLLFRNRECDVRDADRTDGKSSATSASWAVFESFMFGVKKQILYKVEVLSPSLVLPQLCESVTKFARKYLFSDFAALLSALSGVFSVVREHHTNLIGHRQKQGYEQSTISGEKKRVQCLSSFTRKDNSKTTNSRFLRRRGNATAFEGKQLGVDEVYFSSSSFSSFSSFNPTLLSSFSVSSLSTTSFIVSDDDVAEIECELEVLLDACVAVMERHMLSSCKNRSVFLAQQGEKPSQSSFFTSRVRSGDNSGVGTKDGTEISLARVGASQAKALGGKSRLLKKVIASKELVMIAESLHALSWRPFTAFQERLFEVLLSELGQFELNSTQYACLVCLLLRLPPVLSSVIVHSVGDRLKRIIHAGAVTVAAGGDYMEHGSYDRSLSFTAEKSESVVLATAHARSSNDHPLSLRDSCAVVFSFACKLKGTALPLLYDLLVRCSKRVFFECGRTSAEVLQDPDAIFAFIMFVASATWVLHHGMSATTRSHVLDFIAITRDCAARALVVNIKEAEGKENVNEKDKISSFFAVPLLFSIRDLAYMCMMLEPCDSQKSDANVMHVRGCLRKAYIEYASRCDSMEVAQFLSDFLTIAQEDGERNERPCDDVDKESNVTSLLLRLPSWMTLPLQLQERCASSKRLSTLMFLPFLGTEYDSVSHALEVMQLHCRTFATLVSVLRLLCTTNAEFLTKDTVLELVLRKVVQLTRRTARPLDLFVFFEFYGDIPQVVSICLNELVAEAQCFAVYNSFVPVMQVNMAVAAVRRLRVRALRQRWFTTMTPLIMSAVSFSREPLDVVLQLTEYIGEENPELLQLVLKSSSQMRRIHETVNFTVSSDVLLRLLIQLQNCNMSNPTVRRLHTASRKLLRSGGLNVTLEQLAQAMLLPSVEDTILGRKLKRLFVYRLEKILQDATPQQPHVSPLAGLEEVKSEEARERKTRPQRFYWNESLNQLELEHWLALLRFSSAGEPSSYRFVMEIKQGTRESVSLSGQLTSTVLAAAARCTPVNDVTIPTGGDCAESVSGAEVMGGAFLRPYRGLAIVFAFSEQSISSLRRSLGAFGFIAFLSELLRQTSRMAFYSSVTQNSFSQCVMRTMYDGTASPLSYERVWPFVRLANSLVEEMSTDFRGFLRREWLQQRELRQSIGKGARKKYSKDGEKIEVTVDIGVVLEYLRLLDMYDTVNRERRLLLLLPSLSLSDGTKDVFDDDMQLPQRYLYRLLLQIQKYCGEVTSNNGSDDAVCVRLHNISFVFNYCAAPGEFQWRRDTTDSPVKAKQTLSSIFGTGRPLVSDVWMPFADVQSTEKFIEKTMKRRLLDGLMSCLLRDDESLATTRSRFAALGARDLACVAQALLCSGADAASSVDVISGNGSDVVSNEKDSVSRGLKQSAAITVIELLIDMLPSTTAEDLHDVVMSLLPPSSSSFQSSSSVSSSLSSVLQNNQEDKSQSLVLFYGKDAAMEVRRFLAHVAIVMGNDNERFPLPLQFSILRRLHEPHRLVASATAQMILTALHAADDATERHQQHPYLSKLESFAEGQQVRDSVACVSENRRYYAATVALLQDIVSLS